MEYGSDLLGLERVKLMTLAERGLLATMRWSIWANDSLPTKPKQLALVLGLDHDDVRKNLTPAVLSFFRESKSEPDRLTCPELVAQMNRLLNRRERMRDGALQSHIARKENRNLTAGTHDGTQHGTHDGSAMASELNRTEPKRTELRSARAADESTPSQDASSSDTARGNGGAADPFVSEIEAAEARERGRC